MYNDVKVPSCHTCQERANVCVCVPADCVHVWTDYKHVVLFRKIPLIRDAFLF